MPNKDYFEEKRPVKKFYEIHKFKKKINNFKMKNLRK